MYRRLFNFKRLVFFAFLLAAMPANAAQTTPGGLVEKLQAKLIEVMKEAESLSVSARYDRLLPTIEEVFYVPLMARVAASSSWKDASAAQRAGLAMAFRRMSASTLATMLNGYGGESFERIGERPGPQKTLLVETRIIIPKKKPHDLTYVARKFKDRWYIIDVVVDKGISELSVRRSEYRRVLKKGGIDGLIKTLNTKADELLRQ